MKIQLKQVTPLPPLNFELFNKVPTNHSLPTPFVSINHVGTAVFNSTFKRLILLEKTQYCSMYYDKSNCYIGFQFTTKKHIGSLKVGRKNYGLAISLLSFLKFHKIGPFKKTHRYVVKEMKINEKNMWVIDLKEQLDV